MVTIQLLEYATYIYLRSLSINSAIEIVEALHDKDFLEKKVFLDHVEKLIDKIPSMEKITLKLKPKRSGFYAFDGTWFRFGNTELVLLICFDVRTLDLLNYQVAADETYDTYKILIDRINETETNILACARGFYLDGEPGLLKLLTEKYFNIPKQLCAFHKYTRANQIVPFVRCKGIDKIIKKKVEQVLFASTKQQAQDALLNLKRYTQERQQNRKLKKIVGVLKRNFDLLLTHFDHPEMSPYNNVLEGFNHIIKRKLRLTKSFKKEQNIDRWLKLILLDYRFHEIKSSKFPSRNGKSPLELSKVTLLKYYNWIKLVRKKIGFTN